MWQEKSVRIALAMAAAIGLVSLASPASATVVSPFNGGFESNAITSELWGYYIDTTTTPSGWNQADFSSTSGDLEVTGILHRPVGDIAQGQIPLYSAPVDGSNQMFGLELDWDGKSSYSTHTGIYQDLGTMTAGEKYTFNAMLYSNSEGAPSGYRVSFFDVTANRELAYITQANFNPAANGILQHVAATFNYSAGAADNGDTLRLILLGAPGTANHVRTGIDAITVTTSSVPEPGTVALTLSAIASLLAYAWRKHK